MCFFNSQHCLTMTHNTIWQKRLIIKLLLQPIQLDLDYLADAFSKETHKKTSEKANCEGQRV